MADTVENEILFVCDSFQGMLEICNFPLLHSTNTRTYNLFIFTILQENFSLLIEVLLK